MKPLVSKSKSDRKAIYLTRHSKILYTFEKTKQPAPCYKITSLSSLTFFIDKIRHYNPWDAEILRHDNTRVKIASYTYEMLIEDWHYFKKDASEKNLTLNLFTLIYL